MTFFQEIGLRALEILTLIFGILGMTFSFLLLFSPNLARSVSKMFNRHVDIDKRLQYLDKDINIEMLVYKHNILVGTGLILAAAFSFFFFFFNLNFSDVAHVLFASQKNLLPKQIVLQSAFWIAKIASIAGIVFGTLLVFTPNKMQAFESKLNAWLATQAFFDKLNNSKRDLDPIFFRNAFVFGLTGAIISTVLVVLSMINLLR